MKAAETYKSVMQKLTDLSTSYFRRFSKIYMKASHEFALRITFEDQFSSMQNLSKRNNCISISQKILQLLATGMFKVHKKIASETLLKVLN